MWNRRRSSSRCCWGLCGCSCYYHVNVDNSLSMEVNSGVALLLNFPPKVWFFSNYVTQCAVAFFNVNQKTQEVCWYFWVNIFYTNQNLSKKPSVNRAAKILQPKNHFLSNLLKNPKGGPFYVKKIFISDFAQISCVEFFGPKYIKFRISSKSEMKIFLT